ASLLCEPDPRIEEHDRRDGDRVDVLPEQQGHHARDDEDEHERAGELSEERAPPWGRRRFRQTVRSELLKAARSFRYSQSGRSAVGRFEHAFRCERVPAGACRRSGKIGGHANGWRTGKTAFDAVPVATGGMSGTEPGIECITESDADE